MPFGPPDRIGRGNEQVSAWRISRRVQPGAFAHRDYDPERPQVDLLTSAASARRDGRGYERFEYPGGYLQRSEGERYAGLRIDEYTSHVETARGETNARGLAVGYRVSLARHPRLDQNREYLVTAANYDLEFSDYEAMPERKEAVYRCRFAALPADRQFRPRRLTKKPFVHGVQTAVVVGPADQDIHTDALGRVKVQFHWDRYGKRDERSSCWVRVSQLWAGHHFGAQFIPRVGQEVIVDFLEGDPDQPIVMGSVYNGLQKTPYDLPAHKTRSGVKTRTTPDGAPHQGNEIRFEDKQGSEQVFVHAERNQDNRVKNDSLEWVGSNRHLIVTADQFEQVGGDKHLTVTGDQSETIDGTVSLRTGMDLQQKIGMRHGVDAGLEIHLKAGMNVVIEAGLQLTLKVGSNFIHLDPAGVFIQGTMVMINSGGVAGTGSGCSPAAPKLPREADKTDSSTSTRVATVPRATPQAMVLRRAAVTGTPFCEKCGEAD